MDGFNKSFNRVGNVVGIMFAIIIIFIVLGIGIIIFASVKGCQAVSQHGLKGVVEQVLNGPTNSMK